MKLKTILLSLSALLLLTLSLQAQATAEMFCPQKITVSCKGSGDGTGSGSCKLVSTSGSNLGSFWMSSDRTVPQTKEYKTYKLTFTVTGWIGPDFIQCTYMQPNNSFDHLNVTLDVLNRTAPPEMKKGSWTTHMGFPVCPEQADYLRPANAQNCPYAHVKKPS